MRPSIVQQACCQFPCAGRDSLQVDPSYLTIEQALADYAALIFHIKEKYEAEGSPVIAFGGSYGGMLAAWLRAKYPNAVQASQHLSDDTRGGRKTSKAGMK